MSKSNASIAWVSCMLFSGEALAATKSLECALPIPERKAVQTILVTLDDDSDQAEVVIKTSDTTDCSKPNACNPDVYKKTVLPSVIRLTRSTYLSMLDTSTSHTIDIDRTTLAVTAHHVMTGSQNIDNTFSGTCVMKKVDTAKKVL